LLILPTDNFPKSSSQQMTNLLFDLKLSYSKYCFELMSVGCGGEKIGQKLGSFEEGICRLYYQTRSSRDRQFFLDSGMNISDRKVCNGFWMLLAVLYATTLLKENPIALQALMIFFGNVVLCE